MTTTDIVQIGTILAMLVISAYFSASETAFLSVNRIRIKNMAALGDERAALVLRLADNYDEVISTILIGNNIVNIVAASMGTLVFVRWLGNAGVTVSTAALTVLVLIFGEISPKTLAKDHADAFCFFSAPILRFLMAVLKPLNWIFRQWRRLLDVLFKPEEDAGMTGEELITLVEEAENDGGIEHHESELIRAAIEFDDLDVSDVLTPRVDITAVDAEDSLEEVGKVFRSQVHTRLPVYRDTVDSIIGMVHERDFFRMRDDAGITLEKLIRPVVYASANMKISMLLRQFRKTGIHLAVVVDEFGGTEGIVTMEDILENLVGDIWDDGEELEKEFRRQEDGSYVIDCSADLEDMFELFDMEREYDATTVSGWVMQEMERIPVPGDTFEYESLRVTVRKSDARRVLEIQVRQEKDEAAEA